MLPRVILHNAVSLDGRITGFPVDMGTYYGLVSTWKEDCTLAGSETMLSAPDEIPQETPDDFQRPAKKQDDTRPLLAVVDSRGRLHGWHYWRKLPYWRDTIAFCSKSTPKDYLSYLEKRHIDYIISGEDKVDLRRALEELNHRYGVRTVRVDSGGTLNGALLRAGLVSEMSVLIHPALAGGRTFKSIFNAEESENVIKLKLTHQEQLEGGLVWLRYDVLPT